MDIALTILCISGFVNGLNRGWDGMGWLQLKPTGREETEIS